MTRHIAKITSKNKPFYFRRCWFKILTKMRGFVVVTATLTKIVFEVIETSLVTPVYPKPF